MRGLPPEDLAVVPSAPRQRPPSPPRRRAGRLATGALTATFVLIIIAAGLTFVPLPYVVLSPGPATNVLGEVDGTPVLGVEGAQTYPTEGALDFTTVAFDGGPGRTVTVYDLARAWLSDSVDSAPEEYYFPPDASADDVEAQNTEMMNDSQVVAAATALRALGREVGTTVSIAGVADGGPAAGTIEEGDVLVEVDGRAATDSVTVQELVRDRGPGDDVTLSLRRGGDERTVTVRTEEASGRPVIGVLLRTDYDLPVQVTLNTGRVGGPSAGLMFSLAIYDSLTPGALTGGQRIAGTGTINDAGEVGPISGVRQKMVGARDAGATWFLSPAGDCADAVGHVPAGITLLKVTTFDDARAAVEGIAAGRTDGLARCG